MARVIKKAPPLTVKAEIGVAGLKVSSGYIWEEFIPGLQGARGQRIFQEMSLNDATVGAVLYAIGLIIRAVDWQAIPADASAEAEAEAEFAQSLMEDMSHSWEDFISEVLTMLVFGWAYHEIVLKRRIGPDEAAPERRSKFTDGRIGIRKLAPRSQDTLNRWEMQDDGGISGMWQQPPTQGGLRFLPIENCLLFRTVSRKNSPEGVSILRTAYSSYYDLKNIERYEVIGIERELTGLPIVRIPADVLTATEGPNVSIRSAYEKVARDLKFNEQGGIVIPSDVYLGADGTPSAVPKVDVKLITSGGTRAINTDVVIQRKQRGIARSCLADFVMLGDGSGTSRGSYGMHESKVDLFIRASETLLRMIAQPLNSFLLPRIWAINGLDRALMPELRPGKLVKANLTELGAYVTSLSQAGAPLFPDQELESYLREEADLPEKSPEALAAQDQAAIDAELARQEAANAALPQA